MQEIAGPERWGLEKDRMISSIQNDKRKRRKDDKKRRKVGQRKCWNTEDGVILRGEGCNIPLKMPLNIW